MSTCTKNGGGHHLAASIGEKYKIQGVNHETYLRGLAQLRPLTYWDYVEVDTLLSLQKPRTDFKDEEVFIMYHQVTELMLKLMLHEIKQICSEDLSTDKLLVKVSRLNRYTGILINSFDIMKHGMDYDDYNTFRCALAPASGFQSVQFRYIELYCTRLQNLVNAAGKQRLPTDPRTEDYFEQIYWRDAGTDRIVCEKTLTLQLFEERYLAELIRTAEEMKGKTLEEKIRGKILPEDLVIELKNFDYLYNVKWPLVHLETAAFFLDRKGENKAATGGSKWKKYLHPESQQRRFFPDLWTENNILEWKATEHLQTQQ